MTKWFFLAVLGLVLVGGGLSLFGDATACKIVHPASVITWFSEGTVSLILVNSGLCCLVEAALSRGKKSK